MLTSHPEKARQLKRECNPHGLILLTSASKYCPGTFCVLSPGPVAVGEKAKKRMHNQSQRVVLKP